MAETRSDALVFFGATGDLAYKKIFPARRPGQAEHPACFLAMSRKRGAWSIRCSRPAPRCTPPGSGRSGPADACGRLA